MHPRLNSLAPGARRLAAIAGCAAVTACSPEPSPADLYTLVAQGDRERGRSLLAHYQCGSCHVIPGAAYSGHQLGPPLDGFGGRGYIGGQIPNRPETLQRWLQDPQSLLPGTTMPDLGVSQDDARDIAAYLLALP